MKSECLTDFDRFAYDFAVTTKIFSRAMILRRAMFYLNFGHAKKFPITLTENWQKIQFNRRHHLSQDRDFTP